MKHNNALKLSLATAFVAALGIGCASSGYARYDADTDMDTDMGAAAGAEVGTASIDADASIDTDNNLDIDRNMDLDTRADIDSRADVDLDTDYDVDSDVDMASNIDSEEEAAARSTVTALGRAEETRADWVNKFPFYDARWRMRTIETYTFAVPDPEADAIDATAPSFSVNLPPGSVFVEAAGGSGETEVNRVIQHTVNPR